MVCCNICCIYVVLCNVLDIYCDEPPDVIDAVHEIMPTYSFNVLVTYRCVRGKQFSYKSFARNATCDMNGDWTLFVSECTGQLLGEL